MNKIFFAVKVLKEGGVIAYPTEAVFGLGCDPLNADAVARLVRLKNRSAKKGLILIADDFEKFIPHISTVPQEKLSIALATWPGPYTWIFPANLDFVPKPILGPNNTIAIRVTAHPLAKALCLAFGGPLVSTSANISSEPPLRTSESVKACFGNKVDYILEGEVGECLNPTTIRDVLTGEILRF